jgi:hypothetical protein
MGKRASRRRFLKLSLAGGVGGAVALPLLARSAGGAPPEGPDFCITLCNHWSYIGIGWQLGIESCALAYLDAMEMADREPHVKTCLESDARAFEFLAEKFPEVAARLRKSLAAGKVELIGGSYSQPMATTVGSESNIRQIVVGRATVQKALGYDIATMLHEEEFTHPQLPQISALAGYKYASLAQVDTWGRAGCPRFDDNAIFWKGLDGTTILTVPKNGLFGFSPDVDQLAKSADFQKLQKLGKPLILCWEEFGWESSEAPAYLSAPAKYMALAKAGRVEFVTLREYLDKYGAEAKQTVLLPMDAWNKSCTWGLGGDQVRVMQRKMEGLLLATELADAAVSALGSKSQAGPIEKAWKDMLASQSHDVGLCEYSRWQGDRMAPAERLEDRHNFAWGVMGYNHLDAAEKQCQQVLDTTLADLGRRIGSAGGAHGPLAVTVLNPHSWPRTGVAATGRIYPLPAGARDVVVKDRAGKVVPSQIVRRPKEVQEGDLVVAEVAFHAQDVPSAGYDTYYLDFTPEAAPPAATDLKIDETKLILENEHLRVRLAPDTGGIVSLVHKASGREMLDAGQGPFPRLTGRPNLAVAKVMHRQPPEFYDSAKSTAAIDWLAKGPVRAELRAQHSLPEMRFETRISLAAGAPWVEIYSRMLTLVPPKPDLHPADIKEGYWFSLAPSFPATTVLRDYPFGVEPTKNPTFHALTFVDLSGKDAGLAVLHSGTQFFRRDAGGGISNLVMREWESFFTRDFGWPIYAEYRHALLPHIPAEGKPEFRNADALRAAAALARPLLCHVAAPQQGELPPTKSFLAAGPSNVMVTAFRRKLSGQLELRAVEVDGRPGDAEIALGVPHTQAVETNLLGAKRAEADLDAGRLRFKIDPWKIRTFEIT